MLQLYFHREPNILLVSADGDYDDNDTKLYANAFEWITEQKVRKFIIVSDLERITKLDNEKNRAITKIAIKYFSNIQKVYITNLSPFMHYFLNCFIIITGQRKRQIVVKGGLPEVFNILEYPTPNIYNHINMENWEHLNPVLMKNV